MAPVRSGPGVILPCLRHGSLRVAEFVEERMQGPCMRKLRGHHEYRGKGTMQKGGAWS